jgi:hypothetical protein
LPSPFNVQGGVRVLRTKSYNRVKSLIRALAATPETYLKRENAAQKEG